MFCYFPGNIVILKQSFLLMNSGVFVMINFEWRTRVIIWNISGSSERWANPNDWWTI